MTPSTALLAAVLSTVSTTPAAPPVEPPTRPAIVVNFSTPTAVALGADAPTAAPLRQAGSTSGLIWRGQAGLITAVGDTGLAAGVAVGRKLANNENVEVFGELSFGRLYSEGLLIISGGATYGLQQFGQGDTHPYVGGGLAIARWLGDFGGGEAGLQVILGMPFKMDERRDIRLEGRLGILTGNPLLVVVGIGF